MAATLLLSVQAAAIRFGNKTLFENLSFNIQDGDKICLVGRNGSGKSTLMNIITGARELDDGERWQLQGIVIGHLPQELVPERTQRVYDYVFSGIADAAPDMPESHAYKVEQILTPLGLNAQAAMTDLSGGQLRRAALARALVLQPDLLLLDEPFSALDIGMKQQMHRLLLAEQARRPLAVLMITHDVMEAVALADTVLVLAGAPASVRWRLDLALPAAERGDAWVHHQTALLLAQAPVRQAFDLPPLVVAAPSLSEPRLEQGLSVGRAVAAMQHAPRDGCEVVL